MSLSFPRSLRAFHNDSFRPSLVTLSIATVLLVAWGVWFFGAQVTLYETSREFQIAENRTLLVTFPPESLTRIRASQQALVRLEVGAGEPPVSYSALVMNTPETNAPDQRVEVYVLAPEPLRPGLTGVVQVEVDYASPAALIMRPVGQLAGTAGWQP